MASYVRRTLSKDETILVDAKISLVKYWGSFLIGGFFVLVAITSGAAMANSGSGFGPVAILLTVAALFILPPIVRRSTNEITLTNKRFVAKVGLISSQTVELKVQKIESVQVRQTIFGRLFNYGSLTVSGTGSSHARFPDIDRPMDFRRRFEEALDTVTEQNRAA